MLFAAVLYQDIYLWLLPHRFYQYTHGVSPCFLECIHHLHVRHVFCGFAEQPLTTQQFARSLQKASLPLEGRGLASFRSLLTRISRGSEDNVASALCDDEKLCGSGAATTGWGKRQWLKSQSERPRKGSISLRAQIGFHSGESLSIHYLP